MEPFAPRVPAGGPPLRTAIGAAPHNGRRILVCDDDLDVWQLAEQNLAKAGYEVSYARTGPEAMQMIEGAFPGLEMIFLDDTLPDMDGFAVLRWIRANAGWQNLPVVMLTASDDGAVYKGYHYGADTYLTKPVVGFGHCGFGEG